MLNHIAVIIFIVLIITVVYLFYSLFREQIKAIREKSEIELNNILFNKYIGEGIGSIIKEIEESKYLKLFPNKDLSEKGFKYIFTSNLDRSTIIIFQFKDNECTSFYINSFRAKYSLPYWNHIEEFIEFKEGEPSIKNGNQNDRLLLSLFTINRFVELNDLSKELLYPNSQSNPMPEGSMFKYYLKIKENRYLSISIDRPLYFARSKYPVYFYLLSKKLEYMRDFNEILVKEYLEFIHPSIVNVREQQTHFKKYSII